jgi:hypothetical protein
MTIYKLRNLNHPYADVPELVSDTESSVSSYGGTTSNTKKSTRIYRDNKTEDTKSNKIKRSEKDHITHPNLPSPIVDTQNDNIGVLPNTDICDKSSTMGICNSNIDPKGYSICSWREDACVPTNKFKIKEEVPVSSAQPIKNHDAIELNLYELAK